MKDLFINLQLFAGEPDTANTQRTTDTGLSAAMKTFYNTELLKKCLPRLAFKEFAKKTNLPANNGKTVEWRRYSDFAKATTPLQEGITPAGHKISVTPITATIAQYGDYTIITDMVKTTTVDNMVAELTEKHANNAARTIDTLIRDELATGTNVYFAPKADGTVNEDRSDLDETSLPTFDLVRKMANMLKRKDAGDFDGSYIAITHPDVTSTLMKSGEGWEKVSSYNDAEKIYNNEIGKIHKCKFIESTEASIWGPTQEERNDSENPDASDAVYAIYFIAKDAYGIVDLESAGLEMIIKQPDQGGAENPLNQRGSVGWKVGGFAVKILDEDYLVRLECCSDFSKIAVGN